MKKSKLPTTDSIQELAEFRDTHDSTDFDDQLQEVAEPVFVRRATRSTLNLVGAAGEYFVCAELCRQGFLALLTPKNNPLFDVVATRPEGGRSVSIQVKTRSVGNKQGWKLGAKFAEGKGPSGLFVVLVNLLENGAPEFYIYEYPVLSKRIAEVYSAYISKPKRDGTARKDVGFRWFDEVSFIEDDRLRKNNWSPIDRALSGD